MDNPRKTKLDTIKGQVPSLFNMPPYCRFENSLYAERYCRSEYPDDSDVNIVHKVSCHRWRDL